MIRIPELLAPAGGLTQLHAAVNNGADAVYLGGARFNARAKAENFTLPKLRDAICYAHQREVKIYVTFNTLLKDEELEPALEYAGALWDIGADAVIVQDMGLVRMLQKHLPDLPLHLSTQGTVTGKPAVDLMKDFGIRRIVPARELSLEELREMAEICHSTAAEQSHDAADQCLDAADGGIRGAVRPYCELEVFVHGALCMCYSGQCQMSRMLGGGSVRSGNRGLCAQPCRLPYTDDRGRTDYYLSPKDLCLLGELPALCEAGVDSLKIEGRLKSPEYVAVVTGIYRKYLDQYAATGSIHVEDADRQDLAQIYNRGGFTKGYLYENPGRKILSGDSPKNTGIYVGEVRRTVSRKSAGEDRAAVSAAARKGAELVDMDLREPVVEGDGLEFRRKGGSGAGSGSGSAAGRNETTGAAGHVTGGAAGRGGSDFAGGVVTYRRELPGGTLRVGDMKGSILPKDRVFRVTQKSLLERARATFDTEDAAELDRRMARHIPVAMRFCATTGEAAELTITRKADTDVSGPDREPAAGASDAQVKEHAVTVLSEEATEPARNKPADPARLREQLARLGGTPFEAAPEDIDVEVDGCCAVPVSMVNRMRREAVRMLLEEKGAVRRKPAESAEATVETPDPASAGQLPRAEHLVPLMEYMESAECSRPDRGSSGAGEHVLPYIDAVSKGRLDGYIEAHFEQIVQRLRAEECGVLIRTASWIRQFLEAGVRVYGGYGLNVYNEEARKAWEEKGVRIMEYSLEKETPADGKVPLMITEHPVQSKTLTDRKGRVHEITRSSAGDKTFIW